jgi:hypothetical protein
MSAVTVIASAIILIAMAGANWYILYHWYESKGIEMVIAALLRKGSAYIVWFNGITGGILMMLTLIGNNPRSHPFTRKQFAAINLFIAALFAITVLYHGIDASADVAILEEFRHEMVKGMIPGVGKQVAEGASLIAVGLIWNHYLTKDPLQAAAFTLAVARGLALMLWCIIPTSFAVIPVVLCFGDYRSAKIEVKKFLSSKRRLL